MNAQGTNSIGNKNIGLPRVGIKRESEEVEDNYQEDEDISHDRQLIVKLMISGSTQREAARKLRISLNKLKACCKAMQINIWPGKLIRLTEEVGKFLRQLRASGDHLFDDKAKKMLNIIDEVDYAKLRCKASAGSYRRVLSGKWVCVHLRVRVYVCMCKERERERKKNYNGKGICAQPFEPAYKI